MRVENVKNSVWTVDDEEYYKRRTPRGVGPSPSPGSNQSPTLTPHAPSIIDQVSYFWWRVKKIIFIIWMVGLDMISNEKFHYFWIFSAVRLEIWIDKKLTLLLCAQKMSSDITFVW